jgi:epoxyqueuosine reductase
MRASTDFRKLTAENCKFRVVSTSHLPELRREIKNRRDGGQFDREFFQRYLSGFRFTPPEDFEAKSLVVVAMPRPPTKATFHWNGRERSFLQPPVYTAYDEKRLHVERVVAEALAKEGYRIASPLLPLKLLATRSGLAEYGRNNIAYVQSMGSFMWLTAVYSDMSCESDNWQAPKVMERCKDCDLCRGACPTGAICSDRFLLHAEKCLTYHNRKEGAVPFPEWIKPEWHNCIVGCIRCQAACPENRPFLKMIGETVEFTEEETRLLLEAVPPEQLPTETAAKMKLLKLTDYYEQFPRNLAVLLQ